MNKRMKKHRVIMLSIMTVMLLWVSSRSVMATESGDNIRVSTINNIQRGGGGGFPTGSR